MYVLKVVNETYLHNLHKKFIVANDNHVDTVTHGYSIQYWMQYIGIVLVGNSVQLERYFQQVSFFQQLCNVV